MSCCQSHLIGIVVPDPEVFVDWAKERGFVGSYEELCQNPVSHQNPDFCLLLLLCMDSWNSGSVVWFSTGCKESGIRGHESCGEGRRAEIFWTSEESLLTPLANSELPKQTWLWLTFLLFQVKDLHLHPEMFSVANGLLTPTLKSRRADICKFFQEQIASMYSKTPI